MNEKIIKLTGEIPDYKVDGEPCYKKGYFWVSPHNYELVDTANDPDFVGIHDVTLRDGEQLPGVTFLEDERVAIAEVLNEMGVTRIEAGMPAVSDIAYNALKRIAHSKHDSMIYGFARAMEKDVQLVLESGAEGIIIEHCVSPYKCKYGYGLTPEKLVDRLTRSIRMAKKNGLRTVFMGWDWFRTPIEFTHWLIEEIVNETEFDGLTIVDTVGSTLPDAVEAMFAKFHAWYPQIELEFHGHNDFNLGNACALAAIKGGARVVHTAMNGLGERTGNIATEEVVMNLEVLKNIRTGVKLNKIDRTSRLISEISKVPITPQKPILGIRNYTIESGIATDLTRKLGEKELRPSNGTILPALIGREGGELFVYGKNSGVASVVLFLEQRGLTATREEMEEILTLIKREALVSKALVPEETVLYFANQVLNK
jgi:isopropylmalate/homocitrate/citramalate synthase